MAYGSGANCQPKFSMRNTSCCPAFLGMYDLDGCPSHYKTGIVQTLYFGFIKPHCKQAYLDNRPDKIIDKLSGSSTFRQKAAYIVLQVITSPLTTSSRRIQMRPSICIVLSCLLFTSCNEAEKPVKYGSNNGKYLTIHDTKIYYEEYGQGIPLLLLHPGLGSIENLAGILPELSRHFRVISPDAPGHGRSEHADSLSGELLAGYCSELIDQLKLDSAYVMGWSMGGNTALLLAANRPDKIRKVVSGASNSRSSGLTRQARDLLKEYTVEAVKEDKDWLKNYQQMNPEPGKWMKFWQDNQKMWETEIKIPDDKLTRINVPVLIIRGDRDLIKLEHSIALFEAIRYGQLCVYPNTGHEMPDEKGQILAKIAIDFFQEKATFK